jgi:hypothetical protein
MSRKALLFAGIFFCLPAQAWAAKDGFCAKLRDFRTAPFEKDVDGKPLRRTVEFHYIGEWLIDFTKECRFFGKEPAKALCPALMEHSNFEFRDIQPRHILACYGWKTPVGVYGWDIERAVIKLGTDEKGRRLREGVDPYVTVEIDYRARKKGHTALRLSAIPWGEKYTQNARLIDEPDNPPIESDIEP